MRLKIKQSKNRFKIRGIIPIQFNIPRWKNELTYTIVLDESWWGDFELTYPDHYGCKLPGLGHWWDYHINGFGWAIIKEHGSVYVYPRYYRDGVLHELTEYQYMIMPNIRHELSMLVINDNYVGWYIDDEFIDGSAVNVTNLWINNYTPFLGTLGNEYTPGGAVASRDLSMEIKF